MNSYERVMMAINHKEPDRVPIDLGTTDTFIARNVYEGLARLLGLVPKDLKGQGYPGYYVTPDEELLEELGVDVRLVAVQPKTGFEFENDLQIDHLTDGTEQDTYPNGMILRLPAGGTDWQLHLPAISGKLTKEEIERVFPPYPQRIDWADSGKARIEIDAYHQKGKIVQCQNIIMPVTGTSVNILDFTNWCMTFAEDPDLVCRLMDRCVEHLYTRAESFYAAVGDSMDLNYGIGDDVAQQSGLWMSPKAYRKYIKPRHAEIIRWIKARSKAKIIHHCCGACFDIIGDLIDIGVDILNPTQTIAKSMDPFILKREFGKDITFWGGIDVTPCFCANSASFYSIVQTEGISNRFHSIFYNQLTTREYHQETALDLNFQG
jgi:uroporphyrinogen decarboxylase